MSRKHYQALARALRDSGASVDTSAAIANVCADDNPRFDPERFMAAAGHATGTYRLSGGFSRREVLPLPRTATFTCRDIGYGVETGEVILPAIDGPDAWGKRTYRATDGTTVYLFDDEIDA